MALGSSVGGILRPMRGPWQPENSGEMAGALFASVMIGLAALWGVAQELLRLWRQERA